MIKKNTMVCTKTWKSTTVFSIDNNNIVSCAIKSY